MLRTSTGTLEKAGDAGIGEAAIPIQRS